MPDTEAGAANARIDAETDALLEKIERFRKEAESTASQDKTPTPQSNDALHDAGFTSVPRLTASERAASAGTGYTMGINLFSCIFVGGAMGYGLDRWLGTKPWLMILCLFLGFAAGIRVMWIYLQKTNK